jgi:PPOX class probable F420-dependent enzyme
MTEAIRVFLAAPRFATLATINDDGGPHQAITWYLLDGDTLIVNSRRERRWPRNLERDPRAHVAVHDHAQPGHWVGLRARAELLRVGAAAVEDIATMARRYGGDPEAYRGQNRITFRLRVERTFEYWS